MPRQLLMTYVPGQRRWIKGYKGKTYSVSCRQLGCAEGKEASWLAANNWWTAKQAEIDAAERASPERQTQERITKILDGVNVAELQELVRRADAARVLLANLDERAERDGELNPYAFRLEHERGVLSRAAETLGNGRPDRTVAAQVDAWVNVLRAGGMDVATIKYYRASVARFVGWVGGTNPVDVITAPKLEEYFGWLAVQLAERKMSAATAAESMKTARQFVARLGELGLIPVPGNLNSRRLRFTAPPKPVVTFTDDEVKRVLAVCTGRMERTRLYVLLMLNCGMLQADIADLGTDEVDWKAGTITRFRSKRRGKSAAQKVTYKLWSETFDLLRKHRADGRKVPNESGSPRVLLTDKGKPLSARWEEAGRMRSYDCVTAAWRCPSAKAEVEGKPLKLFRKTAATKLAEHPQFKFYTAYFLAHSARTVAERHYVQPSRDEFFAALDWLRAQWLG